MNDLGYWRCLEVIERGEEQALDHALVNADQYGQVRDVEVQSDYEEAVDHCEDEIDVDEAAVGVIGCVGPGVHPKTKQHARNGG